jgi:hypothetical protein
MNLAKLDNLLHASVAFLIAVGLMFVASPPARADAADEWVAYRVAHGLPVMPEASPPDKRPSDEGAVPKARLASLPATVGTDGNDSGNDGRYCDPFLIEMARTDGDVLGESARCK